jgi:hypothetical protein
MARELTQIRSLSARQLAFGGLLAMLVVTAGCQVVKQGAQVSKRIFVPGGKSDQPVPAEFQQTLMRFADEYGVQMARAMEELSAGLNAPLTPVEALRFKLASVAGVVAIAGGQNPYANLLDLVALVSLSRISVENHWIHTTNGAAYRNCLLTCRQLESNIWHIADQVLSPEQQTELRQSIDNYYAANPDLAKGVFSHPQELATALPRTMARDKKSGASVFDIVSLNPFSSLDPAVKEITETRLFAERAMFTVQRMPLLIRWQSELLLLEAAHQPGVSTLLTNTTSITASADRISRAIEKLPGQVATERQALVSSFESNEPKLAALVDKSRQSLLAAEQMSTSLNATLKTFDALMERFGVGNTNEASPSAAAPDPPSRPFDILDYAKTAEQITTMSKELNAVLKELNTTIDSPALDARLQAVDKVSDHATSNLRSLITRAFLLAGALVLFTFVCSLAYRRLAPRPTATAANSPKSDSERI